MAFHSLRGRLPLCPSTVARNMATLLTADLHHVVGPEILSGNHISISISSRIPIHLYEDGCPLEVQPFPHATHLLRKLALLWEHGIHNWSQILCRGPDGRPYFLEERELLWANPPCNYPSQRRSPKPSCTLECSYPLRTPLIGYHYAKCSLAHRGLITQ